MWKCLWVHKNFLVILLENDCGKWWWWWWCGSTGGENESREDRMREWKKKKKKKKWSELAGQREKMNSVKMSGGEWWVVGLGGSKHGPQKCWPFSFSFFNWWDVTITKAQIEDFLQWTRNSCVQKTRRSSQSLKFNEITIFRNTIYNKHQTDQLLLLKQQQMKHRWIHCSGEIELVSRCYSPPIICTINLKHFKKKFC